MAAMDKTQKELTDAEKEKAGNTLVASIGLLMLSVTMVVPTRTPMVLAIKKGDAAACAKAMGLMSTFAALIELVVNPVLGKLSDQHGRKPFMMLACAVNAIVHSLVAAAPMSLPMQFADRMISGSMIFGFLAPAQAAMADLFGSTPAQLGLWGAKSGMIMGFGTTLGPFIGSKLGSGRSFLASAACFLGTMLFINARMPETLRDENKKQFKASDINPVSFLKLFKNRTLGMLSAVTALQSFGDYVNIYDINNLYMIKVLGYGQQEIGKFAMTVGLTQIAGGKITSSLIKNTSLKTAALFANVMWAIGMCAMGSSRTSAAAFAAMSLWTFGHQRGNSVGAYTQKYGAKEDLGRAEIIAATGNLLAYIKVLIPLFYSNLFAWSTTNGRNMPGTPYFVVALLTMVSQLTFQAAAPQD